MANEKKTSRKKFRVAVSGVTADGREINGDMLKAAATVITRPFMVHV